jgi:hypothetical protein
MLNHIDNSSPQQNAGIPITFFTARDLAARWRLSIKTLERWRNEGSGPAFIKLQGRILYHPESILDFESRQTQGGQIHGYSAGERS